MWECNFRIGIGICICICIGIGIGIGIGIDIDIDIRIDGITRSPLAQGIEGLYTPGICGICKTKEE